MATKVTALTETTTLADTDLFYTVYDVAGTPVHRKMTLASLKNLLRAGIYLPEGQLLNGYISATVASNNLTLAIKTMAAGNPSATDPVYVRFGTAVRSITAALSVTVNAGANSFNLGSAELATKEADLFAYLRYNATDGVCLGFARFPGGTLYSDFSTTATNEKYSPWSTSTNAAAGDACVVIGRFAATLSAGAGYTWTVPTYTAANLIQRPIYETRWLTWAPNPTGFSSVPTSTSYRYQLVSRRAYITYSEDASGTSNATTFTASAPFASANVSNAAWGTMIFTAIDNSVVKATPGRVFIPSNSSTLTLRPDTASGNWTASGGKSAAFELWYEI